MNSLIAKLREDVRKRSAYWQTVSEIENMPADVARDLNISTANARSIARKAIYG